MVKLISKNSNENLMEMKNPSSYSSSWHFLKRSIIIYLKI